MSETSATSKGPPKDPLADRLSHGHVVYSKSWKSDLWLYLKNNHVIISMFLAHPKHIYTPIERRIVLLISLIFSAGLALLFAAAGGNTWVANLIFGVLVEGTYDALLGVSAKCGCVQDMNKYIRCCCEWLGRFAIGFQFLVAFLIFIFSVAVFNAAIGDEEGRTDAQVAVTFQFIIGKIESWLLVSIIFACLQFWWSRRSQLKPTDAKALQKWNATNHEGKPKHKGRKKWDKYIGEHFCAMDLPDFAPSYPTTCFRQWMVAEASVVCESRPSPSLPIYPTELPPQAAAPKGTPGALPTPQPIPIAVPEVSPMAQPKPMAMPVAPPIMASVSVTCPVGCKGGDIIRIQHNGALFNVAVPTGVAGGQMFNVQLPGNTATTELGAASV